MLYAAFPGIDPNRLTLARFIGLVQLAPSIHARLNELPSKDFWTDVSEQEMIRRLETAEQFPLLQSAL